MVDWSLRSCRRTAVVLSVVGILSSLLAAGHVHAAGGNSPASCSICLQAAHRVDVTPCPVDFALARIEVRLPSSKVVSLATASLFRARGRAPPPLVSLQFC